ncbi:MAG TPA: HAMP domain-containing methyl-accepting chemotaxis protein [Stellaceae bacterium]|nr:HAMP domain-containing methyl-accepting chemotaxis protein [Stellaceae bacterium]
MKLSALSVKTRLLAALGGISGTTVIAAAVACFLFGQFNKSLNHITEHSVPAMAASLELAAQTQSLAASAPALLAAKTDAERGPSLDVLRQALAAGTDSVDRIKGAGGDSMTIDALTGAMTKLGTDVDSLNKVVMQRIATRDAIGKKIVELDKAHRNLIDQIAPALDRAKAEIAMASMSIGGDSKEMTNTLIKLSAKLAPVSLALSDVASDANLASALLHRADTAVDVAAAQALEKQFAKVKEQLEEQLDGLENIDASIKLRDAANALTAFGTGKDSLFSLRAQELQSSASGADLLYAAHGVITDLNEQVSELVGKASLDTSASEKSSQSSIRTGTIVMIAVATAGVVAAVLVVWLYVSRNVLRRLLSLQHTMRRIADGDLEAEVAGEGAKDEIGEMARTLAVFKANAVEARRLAAEQKEEHERKEVRRQQVEAHIHSFEDSVGDVLRMVSSASTELQATAQSMSAVAEETERQSTAVAAASEQASSNVQTVATAAEQLSSSIAEISRQVATSSDITARAVEDTRRTNEQIQGLSEAAQSIGDVIKLISDIASQTNLLALNATIEAARAGDAGKGFAVVASEVKSLANQTAKATDEIRSKIAEMQVATSRSVEAVQDIGQTIGRINEIATTIASAVEEQGAATQEIARNVQQAAAGTTEVSANITSVTRAANDTGAASTQVLGTAGELAQQSESLKSQVESFLENIRAA